MRKPRSRRKVSRTTDVSNLVEVRVLGAFLEKETTTPEYYPLSLNALVNACNQRSNRDPVVQFDEATVEQALQSLRDKGLLLAKSGAGSRVIKYGHRISERLNLGRRELAILCELMLRGPQTLGELRSRCERMHRFDDVSAPQRLRETCETIGRALDIEHVRPEVLPTDRGTEVRALAEGGSIVAVVGHPAGDDSALAAADVAVAMGAAGSTPGEWAVALAADDVRDAAMALALPRAARDRARVAVALGIAPGVLAFLRSASASRPSRSLRWRR